MWISRPSPDRQERYDPVVDTLTHALSGALLARATAPKDARPRSLPRRIAAGFFACAAPDLDFVVAFVGPVEYLENHRGVTHSLVLLPLWALLLSWVLAKILREPRGWRALYGATALGLAVLLAYVGFQYLQKEKAIEFGERYARSLGPGGASVNAQPRPVSPFNWTVFVSDAETHRFADVNLIREQARAHRTGEGFIATLDS